MTIAELLSNSGAQGALLLIIAVLLVAVIALERRILDRLGRSRQPLSPVPSPAEEAAVSAGPETAAPRGRAEGSLTAQDADDETLAVIAAAVSEEAGIPLTELAIRSVRAL